MTRTSDTYRNDHNDESRYLNIILITKLKSLTNQAHSSHSQAHEVEFFSLDFCSSHDYLPVKRTPMMINTTKEIAPVIVQIELNLA
jgi:hypothetical protein